MDGEANILLALDIQNPKGFQLQGVSSPRPLTRAHTPDSLRFFDTNWRQKVGNRAPAVNRSRIQNFRRVDSRNLLRSSF